MTEIVTEIVTDIVAATSPTLAFARLERSTCRGAAVTDAGVLIAERLAQALFDGPVPRDPALVARSLGRLTLGHVDWLEIHGADRVGTRARAILERRETCWVAAMRSPNTRLADATRWLATVAGRYDLLPELDETPLGLLTAAHVVRARRNDHSFARRCQAIFDGETDRELRLAAAIAWCWAQPEFDDHLQLDGPKYLFLRSIPPDATSPAWPYRLGNLHELTNAVADRVFCTSWDWKKVENEARCFWDAASQARWHEPAPPPDEGAELEDDETNPYMLDRPTPDAFVFELQGLDAVAFCDLEDAYGHAGAVPTFLRCLAADDEDVRRWALESLYAGINHQGSTFSASVAAIPFLVTLACEPTVPGRDTILGLLLGLVTGQPAWGLLEMRYETPCVAPMVDQVPRLLALVGDEDVGVRAAAIHLLAHLEAAAASIVPALERAASGEHDPYVRASLVFALARVGGRDASKLADDSELGRAVALLARFHVRNGPLLPDDRGALAELDAQRYRVHPSFGFNRGRIGHHARQMLAASMPIEEALAALERGERDCEARARAILFPAEGWQTETLVLPEDMSPQQLRYLRWAASVPQAYYDVFWRESGLPHTELWLRRFVGDAAPGPLERRVPVDGAEWPLWALLHAVMSNAVPEHVWQRVSAQATDDDLLAIYDAAKGREYLLSTIREHIDSLDPEAVTRRDAYRNRFHRLLMESLIVRATLCTAITARADALLASGADDYLERTLLFGALGLMATARGEEMPARFVELAQPGGWSPAMTHTEVLRWGLAALPIAQRWPWFAGLELITLTRVEDVRGVRHTVYMRRGWRFLDLIAVPEAAAALAEALVVLDRHRRGAGDPEAHERGLTSGPLITGARDDELPRSAIANIAGAWGPLWRELIGSLDVSPELHNELALIGR